MNPLHESRQAWLADFDWDQITAANARLCAKTGSLHRPTSDGHDDCRDLWNSRHSQECTFREALDLLLRSHRMAPFCFNNGNTFAAVARELIFDLDLPATSSALVRSAAGHYVAGVLRDDELDAILSQVPAG